MVRIIGRLIAVLVTGSLLIPTSALAWGGAGHRLIGDLAYEELTPQGRAFVDRLIATAGQQEGAGVCPVASLADASVWADCVRGGSLANFGYMSALHYVNTPIC